MPLRRRKLILSPPFSSLIWGQRVCLLHPFSILLDISIGSLRHYHDQFHFSKSSQLLLSCIFDTPVSVSATTADVAHAVPSMSPHNDTALYIHALYSWTIPQRHPAMLYCTRILPCISSLRTVPFLFSIHSLSVSLARSYVFALRAPAVLVWLCTAAVYPLPASRIDRWAPTFQFKSNHVYIVPPSASLWGGI